MMAISSLLPMRGVGESTARGPAVRVILFVSSLIVAGCSGSGGPSGELVSAVPGEGATDAPAATPVPDAGDPGVVDTGDGWGVATITVDDVRTEYVVGEFGCSLRGDRAEIVANGDATDGSDAKFGITFPLTVEEWDRRESHRIVVTTTDHRWEAIGTTPDEAATFQGPRVDALEVMPGSDDPRSFAAAGTFLVYDSAGPDGIPVRYEEGATELVPGSFEITCDP